MSRREPQASISTHAPISLVQRFDARKKEDKSFTKSAAIKIGMEVMLGDPTEEVARAKIKEAKRTIAEYELVLKKAEEKKEEEETKKEANEAEAGEEQKFIEDRVDELNFGLLEIGDQATEEQIKSLAQSLIEKYPNELGRSKPPEKDSKARTSLLQKRTFFLKLVKRNSLAEHLKQLKAKIKEIKHT